MRLQMLVEYRRTEDLRDMLVGNSLCGLGMANGDDNRENNFMNRGYEDTRQLTRSNDCTASWCGDYDCVTECV
jgi:hypothetical protein